jgi:hypothetical protein
MWEQSILPYLMQAARDFSAVAMWQIQGIGMLMDAKQQLEFQLAQQELRLQAHKDYQPSVEICTAGSVVKSLAASERRIEVNAFVLSQRSLDRQLGNANQMGVYGHELEKENRIDQFRIRYCDEKDRNNAMASVCPAMAWSALTPLQKEDINKDIDYFSLIDTRWTMGIDFTNDVIADTIAIPPIHNEDEERVLALNTNLFASDLLPRPPTKSLENTNISNTGELPEMQKHYMDMRSIVAKRSVAENSFNAIVGMKSEGITALDSSGNPVPMHAREYLEDILTSLGLATPLDLMAENPSYYEQMELLTKKAYQDPNFYMRLYDTPANVDRMATSMQAIKLMQKFDMFKSFLRTEASTSVLLELAVMELQKEIEDSVRTLDVSGATK